MVDSILCQWASCLENAVHRCATCDLWTCDMHYEHGPSGDGPHTAGLGGLRLPEPEPTRLERENAALRAQLAEAEKVAEEWWHGAGWASGHGDTLADILREMRSQHCAQLAEAQAAAPHEDVPCGYCGHREFWRCGECGTVYPDTDATGCGEESDDATG